MTIAVKDIRYIDLARRERDHRIGLENRLNQLDRSARARLGGAPPDAARVDPLYYTAAERAERDRIERILKILGALPGRRDREGQLLPGEPPDVPGEWSDPLFVAARECFNDSRLLIGRLGNPEGDLDGARMGVVLRKSRRDREQAPSAPECVFVAHVLGLLEIDRAEPPPLRIDETDVPPAGANANPEVKEGAQEDRDRFVIEPDKSSPAWKAFTAAFFRAVGEARGVDDLAGRVLPILAQVGGGRVEAAEFARVMRQLGRADVRADEPQLQRKVDIALDRVQKRGGDDIDRVTEGGIDLPDLEDYADNAIVADNVRLMGAVICGAMLEDLRAFQVADHIMQAAQAGSLPIGPGQAGRMLYRRWKQAPSRMTEAERRTLYAMTMGQPGGDPAATANREFNDLWLRFVSSVSSFVRQQDVDRLLRANLPSALGQQQVRKAARDLAINLSLHGYGMTYYAALDLQEEVKAVIELLSDPEIRAVYGARDMYQVIDTVATLELGGARTGSRLRTLATAGMIITAWLANNVEKIMRPWGPLIDMTEVRSPAPRMSGKKATVEPTDYDLVNACELWLADTAIEDSRVEQLAQPRETPVMTSKPVRIPAFAREFLGDMPEIGVPLSAGANGSGRPN